ncbi:hypothetical protein [Labilibaculum filiforme]|nr:hypothetical protein [Labilibaculum filiforme]
MKNILPTLSYEILKIANRELPRSIFLNEISNLLLDSLKFSELRLLFQTRENELQFEFVHGTKDAFEYKKISLQDLLQQLSEDETTMLWEPILTNNFDSTSTFFTEKGTFWTIDFNNFSIPYRRKLGLAENSNLLQPKSSCSLLIIPFLYGNKRVGLLQLKNIKRELFSSLGTNLFEEFAQTLSAILINQYTQALLQERVKELAFLYEMSNITKQSSVSLKDSIHQIINLIPPAWQYPEITQARITVNGIEYTSAPITSCEHKLVAPIIVENEKCGLVEVIYTEKCPDMNEGPFFTEERSLLNNIAAELAIIIGKNTCK